MAPIPQKEKGLRSSWASSMIVESHGRCAGCSRCSSLVASVQSAPGSVLPNLLPLTLRPLSASYALSISISTCLLACGISPETTAGRTTTRCARARHSPPPPPPPPPVAAQGAAPAGVAASATRWSARWWKTPCCSLCNWCLRRMTTRGNGRPRRLGASRPALVKSPVKRSTCCLVTPELCSATSHWSRTGTLGTMSSVLTEARSVPRSVATYSRTSMPPMDE
eukprot:scaffold13036_cov60-Phaeocystis_antarctica.AAC.2